MRYPALALTALAACHGLGTPGVLSAGAERAAPLSPRAAYGLLNDLVSGRRERQEAAAKLIAAGDLSLVPGIVDALFFIPKKERAPAFAALEKLTGERRGERYLDWVELIGAHAEWRPKDGYLEWKAALYARLDKAYPEILYRGAPARIRPEEIVFGGVGVEGIPALDQPRLIPAAEAAYLDEKEKVFGVSLGGEQRAYPLRILDWHEMLNDTVGGQPVTLSYCTLCGAGILFATRAASGEVYTFGTSGLLYRSNKLMVDRQTRTLWNNLTGEPAIGRLAASALRLEVLPLTLTTWRDWRTRHPATKVLALDREMARRWGYDYRPGAANRQRAGVSFPVWRRSGVLDGKAEVFALRVGERAKAYPVEIVIRQGVINDKLGDTAVLVVADPESGALRAYDRGDRIFESGAQGLLEDQEGRAWRVEEERLVRLQSEPGEPVSRPRLPSHQAFWFGWYGFFPDSEVYGVAPN
jgi:hypothetical protein